MAARKVILFIASSLDGYIASRDHRIDWLYSDQDYGYTPFFSGVDTAVMGRKTWEVSRSLSDSPFGDSAVFVFSHTHAEPTADGVTTVSGDPASLIRRLKSVPGEHIWLVGGGDLIRQFLLADLIDEFVISIHPILLGDGIPLFPPGFPTRKLSTISNRTYRSGLIQMTMMRVPE